MTKEEKDELMQKVVVAIKTEDFFVKELTLTLQQNGITFVGGILPTEAYDAAKEGQVFDSKNMIVGVFGTANAAVNIVTTLLIILGKHNPKAYMDAVTISRKQLMTDEKVGTFLEILELLESFKASEEDNSDSTINCALDKENDEMDCKDCPLGECPGHQQPSSEGQIVDALRDAEKKGEAIVIPIIDTSNPS